MRYFLVKFSRGKIIAFDLDEALSFEGESGPYIQYAVVRARNILQKVQERLDLSETDAARRRSPPPPDAELDGENGTHDVWSLMLEAARLDDVIEQVIRTLEFSILAKYAFSAGPVVQRVLPSGVDRQRGARRRPALARGGRDLRPGSADARARSDGHRDPRADVGAGDAAGSPITPCRRPADYDAAVRRAGGDALGAVDRRATIRTAMLAQVDGLLLTGGDDVDPALFGATAPPDLRAGRTRARCVRDRAGAPGAGGQIVPVLAICRGLQVLNVARGGTLIQDIPSEPGPLEPHSLDRPPTRTGARRRGGRRFAPGQCCWVRAARRAAAR